MVLSFSRPDPSSPTAVAGATFSPSRRGYDQDEVRDFLRVVSAELSRLHERVVFLEREVAEKSRGSHSAPLEINEDTVAELLGEETARIVQAAREAAHKIKARSEETASKLIREATEEAARVREESEMECARRRQDATADAEAEILMAKQQGRDMVNEARAYRERVLADVARRREMAREQLEDLFHGRDRLVQAFERARTATDDVLRDFAETTEEPTEFINLAPTTGPVPVIVQAAEVERAEAFRPSTSSAPSFAPYDQDEEREIRSEGKAPAVLALAPDDTIEDVTVEDDMVDDVTVDDVMVEAEDDIDADDDIADENLGIVEESLENEIDVETNDVISLDPVIAESVVPAAAPTEPKSNVVPLFARTDPKESVVKADDIFARLRRASTDIVAKDAAAQQRLAETKTDEISSEPEKTVAEQQPTSPRRVVTPIGTDTACFARRDEVLVPVIVAMSRKIKKLLADEQNHILDALRAKQPVKTLDVMVGSKAEQTSRFTKSLEPLLTTAAMAGARSLSEDPDAELSKKVHQHKHAIEDYIASTLITPMRERLSRSISDASGSNTELASLVRSLYREWKNQFVDEHVDDIALNAYGRGALAVLDQKSGYCWMVDPDGPACSDAEDNSLAGAVQGGAEFPTGHTHAPAHPGCRCALIPCNN